MLSFKKFIKEARKNPDQNPKIPAYEALSKYKDDDDIYISFTNVDKIGINPQSKFNTPLGIYCYPLKEAWKKYRIDIEKNIRVLPFAADRPNIWVLKGKPEGFVNDFSVDYGSDNFDKDLEILHKIWIKELQKLLHDTFISYDYEEEYYKAIQNIQKYEDMLDDIEDDGTPEATRVFKNFQDKLNYWKDTLQSLDNKKIEYTKTVAWDHFVDRALESAKVKNPAMSFWNLTRLMGIRLSGEQTGIKPATVWNTLLRACGYIGFADKSSKGYIHRAEPLQAVFLSKDAFTVVEKVLNKDYRLVKKMNLAQYIDKYKHSEFFETRKFLRVFSGLVEPEELNLTGKEVENIIINASKNDLRDLVDLARENHKEKPTDMSRNFVEIFEDILITAKEPGEF